MTSRQDDRVLEKNVESLLGSAGDPPAIDADARTRMRARLIEAHARAPEPVVEQPRWRWSPMTLAGAGIIAAAAVAVVVHSIRKSDEATQVVREGDRIQLADGTVAVLGEGGALETLGARHVKIEGQVYLDVAPGKGRFVVDTPHGSVEVMGTRFVVAARGQETTAAVVRGAVKLRSGGGDVTLRAGEQGTMKPGVRPTREPAPRLSALVGWAREARVRAEGDAPRRRSGTLYARDPQFQERDFPLPMRELTLDVVVENQVARIAVDQTFHNPRPETLEGVYRFTTPPDAALSRLAMYVDGKLMESAVVERMAARRIYEDIVYKRRDPALAEWTGAGRVDVRVFPLPGGQDKRLIAAYTQALPRVYDDWTLAVPLPDLDDPVDHVAMTVRIADCGACEIHSPSHEVTVAHEGDGAVVTYEKAGDRLGDSLVLTVRDPSTQARVARVTEADQQYVLVRARPDLGAVAQTEYRPRSWVILDDVSASRGELERKAQADLIDKLVDTIDEDDRVAVATFDVAVRKKLDFVRAADIDRRAVRRALSDEKGGVGATDLAKALEEAASWLSGVDPRDAYVVYLGDGVVTGGARDLAQLRARLAGKAHFVAFGVGDGAEMPSLASLADATGGLAVSIDPADDLAWRALDAIAVLYTPRVTGVRARVLDHQGHELDGVRAHLRGGVLAEGDEAELVVRAPAGADVAAVVLEGTRGADRWTQRIELANAEAVERAGYLPRLWAQREIAALILARNAWDGGSEDERVAHRERLRKEIVALGKQFFLLSPHTSLIVLENDAMYAEYGVTKGKADGWAPYAAPATIPVAVTTPTSFLPDDVAVGLVRAPVDPFYSYNTHYWLEENETRISRGRMGGISGGSGTGAGFGRGSTASAVLSVQREPTAGYKEAKGKSAGFDLDSGTEHAARRTVDKSEEKADPAPPPASEPKADDRGDNAGPVAVTSTPVAAQASARDEITGWVSTDDLGGAANQWTVGRELPKKARRVRWGSYGGGGGLENATSKSVSWSGQPYAVAWNYASDWRLDDLTEFVPAFFPDELDDAIAELHTVAGDAKGSIDDGARRLLAEARRAITPGTYQWDGGAAISVESADRLRWQITHETGLVEELSLEGTTLRRRYPELGLEVSRVLDDEVPALLLSVLPFVPADGDQLARWYVVTRKDDRTITLAPASAPDKPVLEMVFDRNHLVAIRTATGRDLIAIRWDRDAPVGATMLGRDVTVARGGTVAAATAADTVEVTLPLRPPAYWRNRIAELQGVSVGGGVWRGQMRNLLASLAATKDASGALAALRDLKAHGGLALGDLVLASGALGRGTTDDELVELLASAGDRGRVVGRYLSAARAYGKSPKSGVFAAAVNADAPLVSALARHRETLALVERGKLDAALTSLRAGKGPSVLRVIAAMQIANNFYYGRRAADAWDAVAEGAWRNVARYSAARMLSAGGDEAAAAARFADLLASPDPDAIPVPVDWSARSSIARMRGEVGWDLAWSGYRNAILDRGDFDDVMNLLGSAMQVGQPDVDRILGRAADLAAGDPAAVTEIVERALALGQFDRAAPLLDAALKTEPTPALLRLASTVAERQGRALDAADLLDRALTADGDEPVALSSLRNDYTRLLSLRGRAAMLATGPAREEAIDAALAVADRWRELDPDYAQLDLQIGKLLLGAGRRDEAWRQLSTVIERHPMEGDGWAMVAGVMEQEGRLDEALTYWQQAIVIDQTNPTWRMRKAQALFALGRDVEGRALLEEIAKRTWHARWAGVVYQVQQMLSTSGRK